MSAPIDEKNQVVLPFWVQATITYTFLGLTAFLAIIIDDLTLVFGIIAGLAESTSVFILPAILYLRASQIEAERLSETSSSSQAPLLTSDEKGQTQSKQKSGGPMTKFAVWLFMIVGIIYFALSNYFNVLKIIRA